MISYRTNAGKAHGERDATQTSREGSIPSTPAPHIDAERTDYTMKEIAGVVFGKSLDWFRRYRHDLMARDGFPPPINTIGQPRWTGRAVLAWIHRDQSKQPGPIDQTNLVAFVRKRAQSVLHDHKRKA